MNAQKNALREIIKSYTENQNNICFEAGLFIGIANADLINKGTMDNFMKDILKWIHKGEDIQTKPISSKGYALENIKNNCDEHVIKPKEAFISQNVDNIIKKNKLPCIITRNELTFKKGDGLEIEDNPVINKAFNIIAISDLPKDIKFQQCKEFAFEQGKLTYAINNFPLRVSALNYKISAQSDNRKFNISRSDGNDNVTFDWLGGADLNEKKNSTKVAEWLMMWGSNSSWDIGAGHHIAYIPDKGYINMSDENPKYYQNLNEIFEYNQDSVGGVKISINPIEENLSLQ